MKNIYSIVALTLLSATAYAGAPKEKAVTDKQIKQTVDSHISDLKACMAPLKEPLTGKTKISFFIEPDGHVSKSDVDHHSSNADFDKCVAAAFKKWTFPKPTDHSQVWAIYPLSFAAPKAVQKGTLTEPEIHTVDKKRDADAQACIDEANKDLKPADIKPIVGVLSLGMAVGTDGKVVDVDLLSSETGNGKFDHCIIEKSKIWVFPKPKGGEADFKYPLIMQATADDKTKSGGQPDDKSGAAKK